MAVNPGNREGRKRALAMALARGLSVEGAAAEAGVSEKTAHNYRKEPGFAELVRRLRGELFGQAVAVLAGVSALAAATLAGLLQSADEKVKLGAAKAVLDAGDRLRQTDDLAGE